MKTIFSIFIVFCVFFANKIYAQEVLLDSTDSKILKAKTDSNIVKKDTLRGAKFKKTLKETKLTFAKSFGIIPYSDKEKPKIAFVRSLIMPGWGQITNKQYIKLPLVYGGAGVGAYFIYTNDKKFKEFKSYLLEMNENKQTEILINDRGPYSFSIVNTAAEQYRRWKQGTVIGFGVGWLLFAVEANAAAHLKSFDISDDISFKIKPTIFPQQGLALGISLNLNFN